MATSSITDEDRKFVETWANVGPGTTGILRIDSRGDEKHEMIAGDRKFTITTEERMLSQERVQVTELDPFRNGTFRPVVVPDSVTVESNPNALSDDEINKILDSSEVAWGEWLKNIDSVATIRRMMDLAENHEDITLKRVRALEARLIEVRPLSRITTNDPALQKFLDPAQRPSGANGEDSPLSSNRRRQHGMSADYRDNDS